MPAESAPPILIPGAERWCGGIVRIAIGVALALGLSNLAVWLVEPLQRVVSHLMIMRANTAIGLIFAAASLACWHLGRGRRVLERVAQATAACVTIIGGLTALEIVSGLSVGIDELLVPATFPGDIAAVYTRHPGRMSFNAALNFLFLGLALLGLEWSVRIGQRRIYLSPGLAIFAALPVVSGLVGYLVGAGTFTGLLRSTNILLHSAIGLVLLALGTLALRPGRPPFRRIFSAGADGVLLRRLLPGTAVSLMALAWAVNYGRRLGEIAPGEGTALMLYGGMVVLFALIIMASRAVVTQEATALRANAALREEERRSNSIVQTSLDAVVLMDAAGLVVDWNPAAEKIFGWQRAEVVGRKLAECIIPEPFRAAHERGLARYMQTGEGPVIGRRLELSALRRDGSEFPVELSINPLQGQTRVLFVAFIRDITDRKAADEALREGEQRFRVLADNISQLAWMTDESGSVVWFNQRWLEYTGTTLSEMKGWGWQKVHHPDHVERVTKKLRACFERGEPWEDLFPLRGADGCYRWFLSRARPIRDEHGRVQKWFGTNTDVTEQRELAEQLELAKERAEQASSAKDSFIAVLSHELRTPLTPVLLCAASLRADRRLPDDVREDMAMIERNINLEGRLIDDLLDVTRIVKGKLTARLERCDAHALVGHAVEIVRDESEAKPVKIDLDLAARHPGLSGDPSRLQQVAWNLLKNALKFTPVHGRISVRSWNEGAQEDVLVLEVKDTGIGFNPTVAEHLFHPFEQAGRQGDHRFGGLGLGLTIVRAIVELHGGTIRGESDGPGKGATFTVRFPGATAPPSGLVPFQADHPSSASPQRKLKLLVVEDHGPTLSVLTRILTKAGHTVIPAPGVSAALEAVDGQHFDVLVSDLGLPDGTGLELFAQLKELHPDLQGIALSGYGMEEDVARSREVGFVGHIVKPVEVDQLLAAIDAINRETKIG